MSSQSKIVSCKECGKEVRARGLHGHMRLKHNIIASKVTQVSETIFFDSSHNLSKKEIKILDSTRKFGIRKTEPNNSAIAEQFKFIDIKGLEADRLLFKPKFSDYMKHYKRNPEIAQKLWEKIIKLEQRYSWPILINPERYRALKRIFG